MSKAKAGKAVTRLWAVAALGIVVYYAVWGGEYSAFDLRRLRREQDAAADRLIAARQRVDSLRVVASRLDRDPETIERVARERFGMIRQGELLYRFVPEQAQSAQPDERLTSRTP